MQAYLDTTCILNLFLGVSFMEIRYHWLAIVKKHIIIKGLEFLFFFSHTLSQLFFCSFFPLLHSMCFLIPRLITSWDWILLYKVKISFLTNGEKKKIVEEEPLAHLTHVWRSGWEKSQSYRDVCVMTDILGNNSACHFVVIISRVIMLYTLNLFLLQVSYISIEWREKIIAATLSSWATLKAVYSLTYRLCISHLLICQIFIRHLSDAKLLW